MVNYSNGKIYKLVNSVDEEIYVGSTANSLYKRKGGHRATARRNTSRVYAHLNEVSWENVRIVLVEEFPCENRDQLRQREQYWIDELQPSLNMTAAYVAPCPHGRQQATCKECGGSQVCPHNRMKAACKECKGRQICSHGRQQAACKECKGSQVCPHNLMKAACKECLGDKYYCYECCRNFASKASLANHMKSRKHKLEYIRLVWEVSEIRMELADVP